AITTKLEALAFQNEENNPDLAQDLSTVADTARTTITFEVSEGSEGTTIAFTNLYRPRSSMNDSSRMGLRLLRQDLEALAGELSLTSTNETWTAAMTIPRPAL
ncbi:hypothetical protein, partial [Corynebacterium auriscanis]|uniref:hypothetical protein n=1 Tax=Corynebacterium auriscanis TaxID=99807 RepID=UPI002247C77F